MNTREAEAEAEAETETETQARPAGGEFEAWDDAADFEPAPARRCRGLEDAERFEYPWHYDEAPVASLLEQLAWRGYEAPAPGTLSDQALAEELERLALRLADLHVFLRCTDHLDDRELYTLLVEDVLREEAKVFRVDPNVQQSLDLLGGCSEEDVHLWLKHYADEDDRSHWAESFPEDEIPEHVPPQFDRDRHLPPSRH